MRNTTDHQRNIIGRDEKYQRKKMRNTADHQRNIIGRDEKYN